MAVIPPTNGFSWLVLFASFIIAIVGLTRKGQGKTTSIIALALSFVFWIVSMILGIGFALANTGNDFTAPQTSGSVEEAPSEDQQAIDSIPGIGVPAATSTDVSVTLNSVSYDVEPPNEFIIDGVKGSLASVAMSMQNGDSEKVSLSTSSVIAYVGEIKYEASAVFGPKGEWYVYEDVNPGLGTDFQAYFDLPAGAEITKVTFSTAVIFGETLDFSTK